MHDEETNGWDGASMPTSRMGDIGHNAAHRAAQWQTPHQSSAPDQPDAEPEADFDLVEAAFLTGFTNAPDQTSFLRLAQVPFEGRTAEGEKLQLLRVETEQATDVASLSPRLGGDAMRYDPLPAKMVSSRHRLGFVYFDGTQVRTLRLAEALALKT